jgi:hypothetical protein
MLVAVAGIGALTQLVDLHVEGIGTELDPLEGLRALTALKQLTQLSYVQHCRDEEAERGWGEHDLLWENEVGRGGDRVGPVWVSSGQV